jgi:glycine cleavage system H lipoate-binding protein
VPIPALHDDFAVPEGLFVGAGHTGARLESDGSVRIGVDDFAGRLMGRPDKLELAAEGAKLEHEDAAFVLHQGGKSVAFPSPLEGTVTAVNTELLRHPESLNQEPYESGWLLRLRPSRLSKELRQLRIGDEARIWMQAEVARFAEFLGRQMPADAVGATAQDGGLPVSGVMQHLDSQAWERFEEEFLARY